MSTLARVRYRVRQFIRGLRPALMPTEIALARSMLNPAEFSLFLHAEARDRRHSVDLLLLLNREAEAEDRIPDQPILIAALLHDVGKGRMATWHRIAFVLLNAVSPPLARRVEDAQGAEWRRSLWRLRHHAALGADLLEAAGTDPRAVRIVRAHTSPAADYDERDPQVARFIRADDRV
ncbi:MAG: HD domain-containing protein [Dehalococcoidia bacterium]|nr:HD domain-containing protein [Dehalococcoidia bacterium]